MYFSSPEELSKIVPVCDGIWNKEYLNDENLVDLLFEFLLDDDYDGSDSQMGAAWILGKMDKNLLKSKKQLLFKAQSNEVYWKRPFPADEELDWLF